MEIEILNVVLKLLKMRIFLTACCLNKPVDVENAWNIY